MTEKIKNVIHHSYVVPSFSNNIYTDIDLMIYELYGDENKKKKTI